MNVIYVCLVCIVKIWRFLRVKTLLYFQIILFFFFQIYYKYNDFLSDNQIIAMILMHFYEFQSMFLLNDLVR